MMATQRNNSLISTDRVDIGKPDKSALDSVSLTSGSVKIKLQKSINLFSGVTVIVGSIIGSGIFVSPAGVLANTGSVGLSLIVWVLCGVFSMCGAYCYAELGTMLVRSGGDYAYVLEAFGPFLAFARMWVECIVIKPCLTAIQGLTFAEYVTEPVFPGCEKPDIAVRLLAMVAVIALTLVNCLSVKSAARVQDVFTVAKTFALCAIIVTGIVRLAQAQYVLYVSALSKGHTIHFNKPFEQSVEGNISVGTVALSFYSGLFAYIGWNYLNLVMEEFQNPEKNLPRAITISCVMCTILYTLTNIAYYTTVSPQEIVDTPAIAVTFASKLYGSAAWLMPLFVAMSCFGGMNGNLLTTSRMYFASAREGHLPYLMAGVQTKFVTPLPSVAVMGFVSCIYLTSADIIQLINYMSFVQWFAIGLSVVALLYFRKTMPNIRRPLKISLFWPILYLIMTVFICTVPIAVNPFETLLGVIIILTSVPVYIVFVKWQPADLRKFSVSVLRFVQKLFVVLPDLDKTY